MALIARVMVSSRASNVRALAERRIPFNFDQHNSIGDKSGEYGGKNLILFCVVVLYYDVT